jgi:hypothetical protein
MPEEGETEDGDDLQTIWRNWAASETRKRCVSVLSGDVERESERGPAQNRTMFAFLLNDLYFSQAFLSPPHFGAGTLAFSLPCPDAVFAAPDAVTWAQVRRATGPTDQTVFPELARRLLTDQFAVFTHTLSLTSYGCASTLTFKLHS